MYGALRSAGLTRYYDLRAGNGAPVGELAVERRDRDWLLSLAGNDAAGTRRVSLQLQGVRCAACVWLIEQLFARARGGLQVLINPALGRLELTVEQHFDLARFVDELERFGYLAGPVGASQSVTAGGRLLLRLGICAALAMNAMMFALATYLGLQQGPFYELLHKLSYGAATLSVLIGGPEFFASALAALRRRVLHLDVPIALGIALSYAAASWSFFAGHPQAAYFDSLSTFIALMLLGRYVQERALNENRRALLADDGADSLRSRTLIAGRVEVVPSRTLRRGDELLLAPGDLVPVRAELIDAAASCSLDWINGEAEPRRYVAGETLPAGAFNIGISAVRARVLDDFAQSELIDLLRAPAARSYIDPRFDRFARRYVAFVLGFAFLGLGYWAGYRQDLAKALEVATAICVITCPCAIGIAIPLAHEWLHAALRRCGVFVRNASFLDRARSVATIVFDKTGTLTTGQPYIAQPERLLALPAAERQALYDLVSRSLHPMSIAIKRVLDREAPQYRAHVVVTEQPGLGLEATIDGRTHRVGRGDWACGGSTGSLSYAIDGRERLRLDTSEELRPQAAAELAALRARGYWLWILSGDAQARVATLASTLPVDPTQVLSELSPSDKARIVAELDRGDVLMIGDGLNDGPAVNAAFCSGTPAIDRALMPGRTDFYFTTAGLAPVRIVLDAARLLGAVVTGNLVFAVAYNLVAVALCLAGAMQPWLAAVLMPLGSLLVVAGTTFALRRGSKRWKS